MVEKVENMRANVQQGAVLHAPRGVELPAWARAAQDKCGKSSERLKDTDVLDLCHFPASEPVCEHELAYDASIIHRSREIFGILDCVRERLLQHEVLPGTGGSLRELHLDSGWYGERHSVYDSE